MYLIRRWDNVVIDRSMGLGTAKAKAQDASAEQQTQVDVIDYSDSRPEVKKASYFNGSEV